ncbi:hypothetical protein UA38_08120 [Photobacterium kishitanii]|uniref:DUF4381 domain-containing protein n=1 Tax=Photobacterium kishitanii TaxID=318456 RepID=A0AAX0YVY9_9GAMM|nr:DUF4381 domain-containing protein [Photobacterium kishitanii]KJG09808.1 hypothetical protein UB40_11420 [Photobacterium kishitanii]KJG57845.1 hypothetical protein UA38_08120 [Photobacterium kishitanii]KJG61421.1 hypothetical protein UA42_09565 [Photobacterium kishitanii]KJG66233.1 hypothetical protein UA40_07840 [Photobacterium kishitanii]KJG69683.1 hypothetical protein UA41_10615 [Photobacterium kishitanii]
MTQPTAPALPLADIHLHTAPSYWPLAWGWWVVIIVSLIVIFIAGYQLRQRNQHLAAKQEAITLLKTFQPEGGLTAMNTLLKQAALSYFPRATVAPLTGVQWLTFLDLHLPTKHRGFVDQQQLWQQGLFSSTPLTAQQFSDCQQQALLWLQHALPAKAKSNESNASVITKESSNV